MLSYYQTTFVNKKREITIRKILQETKDSQKA